MSEDDVRDQSAGSAEAPPSMLAELAGPIRWVGNGIMGLAALILILGIVATLANDEEFQIGIVIGAAVVAGIGWLCRYAARRLEHGDGPEMPVVASYTFMTAGGAMVVGGIVLVFDDPGGFALIAFGLVFIGAGYLCKRIFATPEGKKAVQVSAHEVGIQTRDGRAGTRRQAAIIHVDEDASAAEIEAAKQDWVARQWQDRPDWVAGRIVAEDAKTGSLLTLGAGIWTVFALSMLVAAVIWGDFIWLVAAGAGGFAAILCVLAVRARLLQRKYGISHFVLDQTPVILGQDMRGEIESGIAKTTLPKDGFRVRLQCVNRWEESSHHSSSSRHRGTQHHRDVLWQDERRENEHATARNPNFTVRVNFALPAEQPATTLGGLGKGISWELVISAAMPGLDYQATFELPVLAPDTMAPD